MKALGVLNYINPIYLLKKVYAIIHEVNNYIYYRKTARKLNDLGVLRAYGIKLDIFDNMYTAINLRPELLMYNTAKELTTFELEYVGNEFLKLENMLIKYELLDLITFRHKRILDDAHYAYKLNSKFKWRELTKWWVLWYGVVGYLYYFVIANVDLTKLISLVERAFAFIMNYNF